MSNIKAPEVFDYLNFYKVYINIDFNNSKYNNDPLDSEMPCGNIGCMAGTLAFVNWVKKKDNRRIIEYSNEKHFSFILKRNTINCDLPVGSILSDAYLRRFIDLAFKEFVITKIISHLPAGIQAFDFKVTYIQEKQLLVTEFLMEKGGISLFEFLGKPANNVDFVKYFTQLSSLMQHLEEIQILHSNVKCTKCLVDPNGNFRIICSDVSLKEGFFRRDTIVATINILGFSNGFVSPEIYNQYKEIINNNKPLSFQNIMPWRADIYSCGILGLCISGAINPIDISKIIELDQYKINSQKHQYIIDKCKLVECGDESLSKKMQYVLEICLSYDPMMRITFKQLHTIMMNIQDKDYNLKKLEQEIEIYRNENQFLINSQFNCSGREELIFKLDEAMRRNQKLEEELNKLNGKYTQTHESLYISEQNISELRIQNQNLEESIRKLQRITANNDKEKNEFFTNFGKSFTSVGSNISTKISEFPQIIHFIQTILDDNKLLKDENLKLRNEILLNKDSYNGSFYNDPKPSKNSPKVEKQIDTSKLKESLLQLAPKGLSEGILSKISNSYFWNLSNMELTKNEILEVLTIGTKSNTLQGIYFFNNTNFDEDCGKAYFNFITENNSMIGIDLSFLNFSKQQKLNIISFAKQKKSNIKVAIVESEAISRDEANQFAKAIGWELSKLIG